MDTLFWKNLSNLISVEHTTKQFYKQYLYKLELHAPGCKSIHAEYVRDSLAKRSMDIRSFSYGGSWWDRRLKKYLSEANPAYLEELQKIKNQYPEVKIRTEEPRICFYSSDENLLKKIVSELDPGYHRYITSITGPKNDQIQQVLESNATIVKKPPKFKYKVWFREKRFSTESRQAIFSYLTGLGDLIKIPENTAQQFQRDYDYIWSCYFYTNDLGVANFVSLIDPDIIREVSELVCLDNK